MLLSYNTNDYKIYNSKTRKYVKLSQMAKECQKADIIFFGELHDDELLHWLEIEFLREFYHNNHEIAVSMEMFERDTQGILNDFLMGKIEESDFLLRSRAWDNYPTDYKPIVEFAKEKKLPLIAANVPRYIASFVNREGLEILDSLSVQEKMWVARAVNTDDGTYKDKFFGLMGNMQMGHGMLLDRLFAAQCVKDDTMAESIVDYLKANPKKKVIHFNGDFHSQSGLGTVERVDKNYKSLVISPLAKAEGEKLEISKEDDISIADYIIIINREFGEQDD